MAYTSTAYKAWDFARDSYSKVQHSKKACVYTTAMDEGGEVFVRIASQIANWDDAQLIAAAPDMFVALRAWVESTSADEQTGNMAPVYEAAKAALKKAGRD